MRNALAIAIFLNLPRISHAEIKDNIDRSATIQNEKNIFDFAAKVMKSGEVSSKKDIERAFSTKVHSTCIEKKELGNNRYFCSYTPIGSIKNSIYLESYKAFGQAPMPISKGFLTIGINAEVTCVTKEQFQEFFGVESKPSEIPPPTEFYGGRTINSDFQVFTIRSNLFSTVEFINGCATSVRLNINI